MKRKLLFFSFALVFSLTACNLPVPTPGTLVPVTELPAGDQPIVTSQPPALTGTTWMWIGFTGPNDQVAVESPASYSLAFQADETVNITADCNTGRGSYQAQGQSIQIETIAMTEAACPPGSRSDEYLQYLGDAASYSFEGGSLYIDLAADGGTMAFTSSSAVTTNEGALNSALLANPWQWTSFTNPVQQYDVENPQTYQLTFHENGTVDIKADCNTASGTYNMDGSRIAIVVGPATLAACAPGSRSREFIQYLGNVATYFFQPGELFIDLAADGGTMRFTPVVP